jgi:hypothetical protein
MYMFNSFRNDTATIEVIRGGSMFIWSNKQENLVRRFLDMIFISREWEQKYPKARACSLTRIGLDHTPLLFDDGDKIERKKRGFRFEPAWLTQPDFKDKMIERWPDKNT